MDSSVIAKQINTLLGTEVRGLARHIDEATPFLTQRTYRVWAYMRQMSHVAQEHAQQLTSLLEEMEVEPQPGAFDIDVANYHYMSVESLLPLLIQEKERQVAVYQEAMAQVAGQAQVADVVQALLEENRDQLVQLQALAKGGSAAAPVAAGH